MRLQSCSQRCVDRLDIKRAFVFVKPSFAKSEMAMKTQEVLKRYGSKVALARVLRISPQAISQWGDNLPELQALKLEKIEREPRP